MGKCDSPMEDMATTENHRRGSDISYIKPCAFVIKKRSFATASIDFEERYDIKGLYDCRRNYRSTEVVVCDIKTQAVYPLGPDTLPRGYAHRLTHECVGHLLIFYLSGSVKLATVPLKVKRPFFGSRKWHFWSHKAITQLRTVQGKRRVESLPPLPHFNPKLLGLPAPSFSEIPGHHRRYLPPVAVQLRL